MIRNYFKTAWRNLWRNKSLAIIKIMGLSIGLMVCMLIFLYTNDELSYDRYHQNQSQLFRIVQTWQIGNDRTENIGTTNAIVGETFAKEIPEIQERVRINGMPVTIKNSNNDVFTESPLFVDPNFLSVFTFPLLQGDKVSALKDPYSIVLTTEMASKYFPGDKSPVGKILSIKIDEEFENFTVTAVAENVPQNSSLKTGMLLPFEQSEKYNTNLEWMGGSVNTFVMTVPQANVKTVESKMQIVFDKNVKAELMHIKQERKMDVRIQLALQPLTSIHLSKENGPDNGMTDGSKSVYSYILTGIAVFILLIACINFINLAIAQSMKRSKEIGIRKVMGGTRGQLIRQFLTESFLVSSIAFVIAIFLTAAVLPLFNSIANKQLSFAYLSNGYLIAGLFALIILTSFISGFYPSLVLSSFQPVKALYSKQKLSGKGLLSKSLIVIQFSLTIFLIVATIAISSQLKFLSATDLGFDTKNLVRISVPVRKSSDKIPALFRNELAGNNNIISLAAQNSGRSIMSVDVEGKNIEIEKSRIDESFIPCLHIPLVAGRNFSSQFPADSLNSVMVNESFIKQAGWSPESAVGKNVQFISGDKRQSTIIGVVKDYHYVSMKEKIGPQLFIMDPNFNYGQIWLRVKGDNIPATMRMLQQTYRKVVPYFPYTYQFIEDINTTYYEGESKWRLIIGISSALFIFISSIGLLGLIMLSIEQRRKEIGIRKVLGSAVSGIIILVSKQFIMLISIAFLVAVPLGYYAIDKWLQDFAYRTNIEWWFFAIAGILALTIALATISFQAAKAAFANPVKSLRTE